MAATLTLSRNRQGRLQQCQVVLFPTQKPRIAPFVLKSKVKILAITDKEIKQRVQLSQERKKQRIPLHCPACLRQWFKPTQVVAHMRCCCPDLLISQNQEQLLALSSQDFLLFLIQASKNERLTQKRVLRLMFVDRAPCRRTCEEVSNILGVSRQRVQLLLKHALANVPIVADFDTQFEIIFEDENMIAVNKFSGVRTAPVHRWKGGSLINQVYGYLGFVPWGVHRLDFHTSGVVVMAKSKQFAANLCQQFRNQVVAKTYLALTIGVPNIEEFSVHAPIGQHSDLKEARIISPSGKSAYTEFKVIKKYYNIKLQGPFVVGAAVPSDPSFEISQINALSLIECKPRTGRTHQIRLHLQFAGCPIFGDMLYGLYGCVGCLQRLALHASELDLEYPPERLQLQANLPKDMQSFVNLINQQIHQPNQT
eukprot:TRINITY_DN14842_c0_g1_i4.p1 TRINITY_DN14842_c0_g1~~TRINITY_DN14842_c0_g1_i4.p1  ORF type:complete len:424 (-),score=1.96 TRINITY_DN14842_c0_g1_i4:843-2114(-)